MIAIALLTAMMDAPVHGTFETDVVALVRDGREVAGNAEFRVEHEDYAYLFASAENLRAFTAEPKRFGVQQGGACGRMGALSGRGDTSRFAVWDGKLYIFASDGCRTGFLADPKKLVTARPEELEYRAEGHQKGQDMITAMRRAAGVTPDMELPHVIEIKRRRSEDYATGQRFTRGGYEQWSSYQNSSHKWVYAMPGGQQRIKSRPGVTEVGSEGIWAASAAATTELGQIWAAHPISWLIPWPFTLTNRFDVDGDAVLLNRAGLTVRVVPGDDGLPRTVTYHGRGPSSAYGEVKVEYLKYKAHRFGNNKLQIPVEWRRSFNGEEIEHVTPDQLVVVVLNYNE